MALPEGIPTVTVTGRYLTPAGQPLTGAVVWRAGPGIVTFDGADVILGGPVSVPLDAQGAFTVTLPATDAPGMNPTGWSYAVTEQLAGVSSNRAYNILLPAESPAVDIADLAPTDPATPTYVAVRGDSAYEVALAEGFVGTEAEWLASLVGPVGAQGPQGVQGPDGTDIYAFADAADSQTVDPAVGDVAIRADTGDVYTYTAETGYVIKGNITGPVGEPGAHWWFGPGAPTTASVPDAISGDLYVDRDTGDLYVLTDVWYLQTNIMGPQGAPGVVQSVNGQSAADVVLAAADVGAYPETGGTVQGSVTARDGLRVNTADVNINSVITDAPAGSLARIAVLRVGGADRFSLTSEGHLTLYGGAEVVGQAQVWDRPDDPAAVPGASIVYSKGGRAYVREGDGAVLPVGGVRNTWTPQSLGFQAWALDPSAVNYRLTDPPTKQHAVGRTLFSGLNITEDTDVNNVVIFARGWAGSTLAPDERFYAAIYDEAGNRVADSGLISVLPGAGQIPGSSAQAQSNHTGAVPVPLLGTVTLTPGRYWAAFLHSAGAANNFYYMPVENWSPSAPGNFFLGSPAFQRQWCLDGQSSTPTSVDPTAGNTDHDPPIMALALL